MQNQFEELNLNQSILKALGKMGFTEPTPIQEAVIPPLLEGRDVIAQAQTGTGKTAAFGLPVLELLSLKPGASALILTPTRELARQVSEQMNLFAKFIGIRSTAICGGESFRKQIEAIKESRIIVATPGRLLDLYRSNRLKHFHPGFLVFDEADEMLDMGFMEDIENIVEYLPDVRQTLLFSATMSKPIMKLAKKLLSDPLIVNLSKESGSNLQIDQKFYMVRPNERAEALMRLIDCHGSHKALIFCATKKDVDQLAERLSAKGYSVASLHGDMAQPQRKRAIDAFRFNRSRLLIATDVAARGLDVSDITHVYNYEIPQSEESYIHRIGRTGRAGKAGVSITFVTPKEKWWIAKIGKHHRVQGESIPTLEDLKKLKTKEILTAVQGQPIDSVALELLKDLEQTMDPGEINASLISLLLSYKKFTGPERIGMTPGEFKAESRQKPRKNRRIKFKKFSPRKKRVKI